MMKTLAVSHINVVCETGSALARDGDQENGAQLPPSGASGKLLPRVCNRLPGRCRRAAFVYVECGSSGTHG